MPTLDETLAAILAELKGLRADVARVDATAARNLKGTGLLVTHLGAAPRPAGGSSGGGAQAIPDDVLDAPGGDPDVRFEVKAWKNNGGDLMKGKKLSECPAPFLDLYAAAMESSANDPTKARFRDENLHGARIVRAWAVRLRGGWRPAGSEETPPSDQSPPDEL